MKVVNLFQCGVCKKTYKNKEEAELCCIQSTEVINNFKKKLEDILSSEISSKEDLIKGILVLDEIEKQYYKFETSIRLSVYTAIQETRNILTAELSDFLDISFGKVIKKIADDDLFKPINVNGKYYSIKNDNNAINDLLNSQYDLLDIIKKH